MLVDLVAVSARVAESSGRLQKVEHLADFLRRVEPESLETAVAFLSGAPRQGRMGLAGGAIREALQTAPVSTPTLALRDVEEVFDRVASISGTGASGRKLGQLRGLFSRATAGEQDFLVRLLFGELRQGALEGVLVDAVARASGIRAASIRRAAMLEGALPPVARTAMFEGERALDALVVRPFRPILPMLAQSSPDVEQALSELGETALEFKLDGARVQVHKAGDEVRVYSRTLRDITEAVPELVGAVRRSNVREAIFDGEAIALGANGTPQPFQVTMRRFGRKLDVANVRETLPMSVFFFDCVYIDGTPLIDEPLSRRTDVLAEVLPESILVPRLVTADPGAASRFMARARDTGHEGLMAKSLAGLYAAGRRGQSWLKVKPAHTLDLVVLAVEWGSGRRRGSLSNLHLGARDEERGGFVMLGKTFKGLTDEMLAWQTKRFLELETGRDKYIVFVKPEVVVEIAFNDLQESPRYPGGLALRFARVKRHRADKSPVEADTFQTVRRLYEQQRT